MRGIARGARAGAAALIIALLVPACASGGAPADSGSSNVQQGTVAAPFDLVDQFGHRQELSDFRGSVVLLTFIDSECTTVCPITSDLLRRTKEALHGDPPVQLLAIDANPTATSVRDVRRWSTQHRMLNEWLFLTGALTRLRRVWADYGVKVTERHDEVAHTSVVFLIDPEGRIRGVFPIAARSGMSDEVDALVQTVRRIV